MSEETLKVKCEMVKSLFEMAEANAYLNGHPLSKEDMMKMQREAISLILPDRYKEMSASDVRQLIIDKYVRETSLAMMQHYEEGTIDIPIDPRHVDLLPGGLADYWVEKGFKVDYTDRRDKVTLKWL